MVSPDELATSLQRSLRPLVRRLQAERSTSRGKSAVLALLEDRGRATASEVAAAERITQQAVAMAVRELGEAGLVERAPDTEDARRRWITLTASGRERLAQDRRSALGWLEEAVADRLSPEERSALAVALPILEKLSQDPSDA